MSLSFRWVLSVGVIAFYCSSFPVQADELVPCLPSSTSSTTELAAPPPVATSTELAIPLETTTSPSGIPPDLSDAPAADVAPSSPYECSPYLRELLSDPSSGPEWVQVGFTEGTDPISCLLGSTLSDGKRTTFTFTTSTLATAEYTSSSMRIFFPMPARSLTNTGATLQLLDATKQVIDETVFPSLKKGERWVRTSIEEAYWERSSVLEALPLAPVVQTIVVTTPTVEATTVTTGSDSIASELSLSNEPAYASEEEAFHAESEVTPEANLAMTDLVLPATTRTAMPPAAKEIKTATKSKTTSVKKPKKTVVAKSKPKTTKPKAAKKSAPKPKPPIPSYTFDMLDTVTDTIQVRLRGTVGSSPGLLTQQTFVLLNPDGRGLLIRAGRAQPLPAIGKSIELTGTLRFESEQLTLTMLKDDRWKALSTPIATPSPRPVDLLAPSQEDAWSFVSVTATVREVHTSTVSVETDAQMLTVKIRPVLRYRTARLKAGDVIQVQGLLDIRQDPAIYPRTAEEIIILQSAKAIAVVAKTEASPPWLPLGAAGTIVALGQGLQEWRRRRESRRLERRLTQSALVFEALPNQALARHESP